MRRALLVVLAGAVIFAALYVPRPFGPPGRGNSRRDAFLAMRQILRAEDAYRSSHPEQGFAATLAALGPSPGAGLIDAELAGGTNFGYRFTLTSAPADPGGSIEKFTLDAVSAENHGYRFFADESTFVHLLDADSPATPDAPLYIDTMNRRQDGFIGFTPDGQSVAILAGTRVTLVDVATGKATLTLTTPGEGLSFGLSDEGRALAWRIDENATLWDMTSGREVFRLARSPELYALTFSSNGRWLAGTTGTGDLRVWDVAANRALRTLGLEKNLRVKAVAFNASGRALVATGEEEETTAANDRRVIASVARIWDVATGNPIGTLRAGTSIQVADLGPDGTRLTAKSGPSIPVDLWDVATGTRLRRFEHSADPRRVRSVAFSPDGRLVATSGEDHVIKFWDTATGNERRAFFGPWGLWSSRFDPTGTLFFARASGELTLWDTTTWSPRQLLKDDDRFDALTAAFSADGRVLAAGDRRSVRMWDVATGNEMRAPAAGDHDELTFSRDGRLLVLRMENYGAVDVLDAASGSKLYTIGSGDRDLPRPVFSPEQRWLAAGDKNGAIKVWEVATGRLTREFQTRPGSPGSLGALGVSSGPPGFPVAIDVNGGMLAALHTPNDGSIEVWDVATGMLAGTIRGGPLEMSFRDETMRFSPDGRALAMATSDSGDIFRMVDVTTGQELYTLPRRTGLTAFGGDGRLVATAMTGYGDVKLLDAASGRELRALNDASASAPAEAMSFSRDGRSLAVLGADNTVRVWNVMDGRLQSSYSLLPGRP